MLVGDLLSKELNKCIFLDVDIYVCKDLSELFNIDIKDNYIAEVSEPDYYISTIKKPIKIMISFRGTKLQKIKYFIYEKIC